MKHGIYCLIVSLVFISICITKNVYAEDYNTKNQESDEVNEYIIDWEIGNIDSFGTPVDNSSFHRTGFINKSDLLGGNYLVTGPLKDRVNVFLYDSSHNYVGRGNPVTQSAKIETFSPQIEYVRMNAYQDDYLMLKIEFNEDVIQSQYETDTKASKNEQFEGNIVDLNHDIKDLLYDAALSRPPAIDDEVINKVLAFVHFTDIHSDNVAWDRICDFLDYYQDLFEFSIHTGDFVSSNQDEYVDLYAYRKSKIPIFNCLGDHDVENAEGLKAEKTATHDLLFYDSDNWNVIFPYNGAMYYYRDFTESNIRFIVIDEYYFDDDECDWLVATLEEARRKGFHVITASHTQCNDVSTEISTFNPHQDYEGVENDNNGIEEYIREFVNNGGVHIIHLCGDKHHDSFGKTADGTLEFSSSCATRYGGGWRNDVRTPNTKSFDCFNAMFIDTNTGMIKLVRVGSNSDNYLRNKNVIVYDYINDCLVTNY